MSKSGSLFKNPTLVIWGALLAAFFAANGVFIYLAMSSNPGLVVDNYYERGQDYEKHMLQRRANAPDWQLELTVADRIKRATPAIFELVTRSGGHEVLNPDKVTVFAYRPTDAKYDFATPMTALSSGSYRAEVTFPLPGNWDLLVTVEKDGIEHSAARRIQVAD